MQSSGEGRGLRYLATESPLCKAVVWGLRGVQGSPGEGRAGEAVSRQREECGVFPRGQWRGTEGLPPVLYLELSTVLSAATQTQMTRRPVAIKSIKRTANAVF